MPAFIKRKPMLLFLALFLTLGGFFAYMALAFPKVRCEGAHLNAPDEYADCLECHLKTTPKVSQDWHESKHGVLLVKCVVCHGQPDGKGSIPFNPAPDPMFICARCHAPSIQRMEEKFGLKPECESCHPNHQNPMHRNAYENRAPSDKTNF